MNYLQLILVNINASKKKEDQKGYTCPFHSGKAWFIRTVWLFPVYSDAGGIAAGTIFCTGLILFR